MRKGLNRRCSSQEDTSTEADRLLYDRPALETVSKDSEAVKPRPRACRIHLRRRLAAAWPAIVTALLSEAAEGSVSHITLAAKLAGLDFRPEVQQKRTRPEKRFATQLLEEIEELEKKNIAEFGPF